LAQTKVITGTVYFCCGRGRCLPGVTVQVKGTTVGAITDLNGKYSLTAPATATTLILSYVGMKTMEVEIGGRSVVDAVMDPHLSV